MTVSLTELGGPTADPLVKSGRYQIDYRGNKTWQRMTNFCPILEEQFALIEWKQRATLEGAHAVLHKVDQVKGSYKDMMALVEEAMEAAGANIKRDYGTAIHKACEQVDLGMFTPADCADPLMVPDVTAYTQACKAHSITPVEIEQVVVIPELGTAGRFDRIVNHQGTNKILDLKTGTLKGLSVAIQLAGYAHAEVIYNPADKTYRHMPEVSQTQALVAHIPMHTGTCDIYTVDIALGWEYAQLAKQVRDEVRKAKLTRKLKVPAAPPRAGGKVGAVAGSVKETPTPPAPTNLERLFG